MDKIKLVNKKGKEKEFDADHAKEILKYEKARNFSEWSLPKNSPYTADKDGNLIKGGGPQIDKGAQAPTGDTESEGQESKA